MKYEILDVERRNFLARLLTIDEYKVTVRLDNGLTLKFDVWVGWSNPTLFNLVCDIEEQLKKILSSQKQLKKALSSKSILPQWKVVLGAIGKKGDVEAMLDFDYKKPAHSAGPVSRKRKLSGGVIHPDQTGGRRGEVKT